MIQLQYSIIFLLIYIVLMAPSLLLVKQTYRRILNLKAGFKGITFLPITVGSLMIFVYFIFGYLSQFPFFNLSWLGYNIALGPYADQGFMGILPFLPFLIYTFIHVNYFEEYYFRRNLKRVVIWGFLHMIMGVLLVLYLCYCLWVFSTNTYTINTVSIMHMRYIFQQIGLFC